MLSIKKEQNLRKLPRNLKINNNRLKEAVEKRPTLKKRGKIYRKNTGDYRRRYNQTKWPRDQMRPTIFAELLLFGLIFVKLCPLF